MYTENAQSSSASVLAGMGLFPVSKNTQYLALNA